MLQPMKAQKVSTFTLHAYIVYPAPLILSVHHHCFPSGRDVDNRLIVKWVTTAVVDGVTQSVPATSMPIALLTKSVIPLTMYVNLDNVCASHTGNVGITCTVRMEHAQRKNVTIIDDADMDTNVLSQVFLSPS